jgi:GNAT superfamily N-acetyltransferase
MFAIREATQADRPEIESLIAEMIPGCDVAARWRWLYQTNPGGPAITWLAESDKGEIAGCTSFFPFRLWLEGTEVRGALGGDGYVRPAFRRQGIGAMLHEASRLAMPSHGISCMYGAPGSMNLSPLKHGGSRESGQVIRWVRPLRGQALHVPPQLDWLFQLATRPRTRAKLVQAIANDPRVDLVWHHARAELRLAAIRDGAFYTWRFQHAPAGLQTTFVIVEGSKPIGACALEPNEGGRVQRIVDLLAIPGAWHECLQAIVRHCAATEAELVDIRLLARDSVSRGMWKSLFIERHRKPFLCMIPFGGDRRFVDPDRWFYTNADSDLDDHND